MTGSAAASKGHGPAANSGAVHPSRLALLAPQDDGDICPLVAAKAIAHPPVAFSRRMMSGVSDRRHRAAPHRLRRPSQELPNLPHPLTYLNARGTTGAELAMRQQNARKVRIEPGRS